MNQAEQNSPGLAAKRRAWRRKGALAGHATMRRQGRVPGAEGRQAAKRKAEIVRYAWDNDITIQQAMAILNEFSDMGKPKPKK